MPTQEVLAEAVVKIEADFAQLKSGLKRARRVTEKNTKAMRKSADKVKKSFGGLGKSVVTVAAALAAFRFGQKVAAQVISFAKAVADLSAITGATGEDLKFFQDTAREVGKTTTKSAVDFLQAIKLIASAKPELLEAKEALAKVTKEAVILSEASGLTLPAAADALTTALNQFLAPAEDAGKFINIMAAGAKLGAAEIPALVQVLIKAGTDAQAAGVKFEEFVAIVQRLAEFKTPSEILGTSLRNIFLILSTGADDTNPKIVGITKALENLKNKSLSTSQLLKIFGKESVTVAQQLIGVSKSAAKLTKQLVGTQIAYEQAKIRTEGLAGATERLGNAWAEFLLTIGDEGGIIDLTIRGMTALLTITSAIIQELRDISNLGPDAVKIGAGRVQRGAGLPSGIIISKVDAQGKVISRKPSDATEGLTGLTEQEITEGLAKLIEAELELNEAVESAQRDLMISLLESRKEFVKAIELEAEQELKDFEILVKGKIDADEQLAEFRKNLAARVAADIEEIQSQELDKMAETFREFARDASRELGDLALAGELSAKTIGEAFARLALNILIQKAIIGPTETFITGLFGGKAGGGTIAPNTPTLVGERGPELIVPKTASTVINASNTKGMGGNVVNITQNITFTTDVKNSIRAEVANAAPIIANAAVVKVFDQMNRAGK